MNTITPFTREVIEYIKKIPRGKVATYGFIAAMAGNPRAARQVSWILHSATRKHGLPWWRVVNGRGTISLVPGRGYEVQRAKLEKEKVGFDLKDRINLAKYLWKRGADHG